MPRASHIYLDNAAGAPLLPEALEAMLPYMKALGNPNAVHTHGRRLRVAIERARKEIATLLGASPSEIYFTCGGTEANNWALRGTVRGLGLGDVISSSLEHASVVELLEEMRKSNEIKLHLIAHDPRGSLDESSLERCIEKSSKPVMISLMHSNNEIGNLLNTEVLKKHIDGQKDIYLHSDMVQSIAHLPIDLESMPFHLASASAHKFHGPKGIGFLYVRQGLGIAPLLIGGSQERSLRAGTENVAAIVGMATALRRYTEEVIAHTKHLGMLKSVLIEALRSEIPEVSFNGHSAELGQSLPTVLSVSLPEFMDQESLLMCLDVEGISASVGSACSSGSSSPSRVLQSLQTDSRRVSVRLSLSPLNTKEEVLSCAKLLAELVNRAQDKK